MNLQCYQGNTDKNTSIEHQIKKKKINNPLTASWHQTTTTTTTAVICVCFCFVFFFLFMLNWIYAKDFQLSIFKSRTELHPTSISIVNDCRCRSPAIYSFTPAGKLSPSLLSRSDKMILLLFFVEKLWWQSMRLIDQ